MLDRPSWLHPSFRLIEGGDGSGWTEFAWSDLASVPSPPGGVVRADRASRVLAALAAAERAGVGLLLSRRDDPSVDWTPPPGFSVTLETSGTTGAPKRVRHDFERLRGRVRGGTDQGARWLLAYEAGAFAGLQVILTAASTGAVLVSAPGGGVADLAQAARRHAVTHVSGTPSFWRAFLMALGSDALPLTSITLGGEAVDQPLLDRLADQFPAARLRHIYASTEAGALFAVADKRAGFPAAWLERDVDGVALRVRDGVLETRSPRAMIGGGGAVDADGWLSTGDLVERRGDRMLFAGRLDGLVNVGGVKVSPEAVEQRLLAAPGVVDALVAAQPNPITGFLLTALVVPETGVDEATVRAAIRGATADLVPAARPRVITLTDRIPLGVTGKKGRKAGS
ncbi:fatty acid--CoA ligase family protein [Azospirillum sp.]|uniref:ANL family adenylate-forming protein n=1 Tax=Azospirillum sp. TaxID=34012 RepID=UPI002618E7A5|nr:fatty acid--CoA ligase family protein [Azospirillum sp.]